MEKNPTTLKTVFNQYLENEDMDSNYIKNNFQSIFGCCGHVQIVSFKCLSSTFRILFFIFCKHLKTEIMIVWFFCEKFIISFNNFVYYT